MRYFYKEADVIIPVYGKKIKLDHSVYAYGTLYSENNKGIIVTQQSFNAETKQCIWTYVDDGIANDIYLCRHFPTFFMQHATNSNYPIYELRKLMWLLRMKPLQREHWENYFNR